jgi:putative spermidine/putrescine transport system ATP-binding protein
VFNDGILQQIAPPNEPYEAPANKFVAQFIGENNAISGQVRELSSPGRCVLATEDGSIIHATASDGLAAGMAATLALRPERLHLSPADGSCCNRFNARVEELIYYGDHTRLRVAACGAATSWSRSQPDVLSVLPGNHRYRLACRRLSALP